MKCNTSGLQKILLWLAVLWMAGCSSPGVVKHPPLITPSLARTPTHSAVETPNSLPFTGKIAFLWSKSGGDIHIYVMNANGSELTDVTPDDLRSMENLSWSSDGQFIAFDAMKNGTLQIFKMRADGSSLVQLTFGEQQASRPSWSPDGQYLMFMSSDVNIRDDSGLPASQIYLMNSDGSDIHRFIVDTKPDNTSMSGTFRMDGFIAVHEPFTKYASVYYVVNLEGIIQEQFPELRVETPIVWSPDGKIVVQSGSRRVPNDCLGFVLMKFDGSNRVCLVTNETVANHITGEVSWSPDGEYIIFSVNLEGETDIYAIKTDDSGLTRLTNLPGSESGAIWSP